MKAYHLAISK